MGTRAGPSAGKNYRRSAVQRNTFPAGEAVILAARSSRTNTRSWPVLGSMASIPRQTSSCRRQLLANRGGAIKREARPRCALRLRRCAHDQQPQFRHAFDSPADAFTAQAAVLIAAVGHLIRAPGRHFVDHHAADVELVPGLLNLSDVTRENA